jgi:hypothetical protein
MSPLLVSPIGLAVLDAVHAFYWDIMSIPGISEHVRLHATEIVCKCREEISKAYPVHNAVLTPAGQLGSEPVLVSDNGRMV